MAETSITIDDVTCVIDAGRVKELGYDAERGIARLQVLIAAAVHQACSSGQNASLCSD